MIRTAKKDPRCNEITKSKVEGVHRRSVSDRQTLTLEMFDVDINCLSGR